MSINPFRKEKKKLPRGGFPSYTKMLLDPAEAEKEAIILEWLYENSMPVPKVLDRNKGVVTMDFIKGKNLSEILESGCKKEELFEKVIEAIAPAYGKKVPSKIKSILRKGGVNEDYSSQAEKITKIFNMNLWKEGAEYIDSIKELQKKANYFVFDDLNPDNIRINENGKVYVFDMGSSMFGVPQTDLARLLISFNYEGDKDAGEFALNTLKKYCKLEILNSNEIYSLSKMHVFMKMIAGCELLKRKNNDKNSVYEGTQKHFYECIRKSLE